MVKKVFTIFFTVVFLLTIICPAVGVFSGIKEVAELSSNPEEKQKKGDKDFNLDVLLSFIKDYDLDSDQDLRDLAFLNNSYPKPHLAIISPPPDLVDA